MRDLKLPRLTLTDAYGPAEAFIVTNRDIPVHAGAAPSSPNAEDDADKPKKSNSTKADGTNIGRVLPNTSVYIVDEDDGRSPLPVGVPGELCIAGAGVANGYLDAALSAAKFVPNPHATEAAAAHYYHKRRWAAMYRSGDRAVLRADGSVVFLGRTQGGRAVVKLRGLRIDLGEVAGAVLAAAPRDHLADAAVTVRARADDPEQQFLVCYVVLRPGRRLEAGQLEALVEKLSGDGSALPRYMVPSVIVPLDRLPVTPNGKLDYRVLDALPLPDVSSSSSSATPTAPVNGDGEQKEEQQLELTEMEKKLRAIWIDVVGPAARAVDIGPRSSFFAVGGSSLLLVHLLHTVNRLFAAKVHLRDLRAAQDLRGMAVAIAGVSSNGECTGL
ncbi:acetyl-CoA synthetase-like protein [Apiospora hydei]|uniref:Acetyl-CoA synthetase-like protein n=1 Tax=Apiospora hydei TaxID=1337664 RepID=A0ABR1VXU9_9PEZI